jgi:hypothetical protein
MKSCALVGVGFQALLGVWLGATTLGACAGEPQRAKSALEGEAGPATEKPVATPIAAAPEVEPAVATPEPEPEAQPTPEASPPAEDPNAPRDIKYVVTPEGLKIEVAGVRFLAKAEAKPIAQGWGARITVKAEATDGKEHVLLNPKNGPLAFAAAVERRGSEAERIPDAREGEGELTLRHGSPLTFSRDLPPKGGRVLGIGDTLDVQVALWGLGETREDRRPVKQFFHVKMAVDKRKPRPLVTPPLSAAR